MSNRVLAQYSEVLPLRLSCDASPYEVGAVLSQLDKEALAIVANVKWFHHYLYGRQFQIMTDHKPLLGILSGDRQTPQMLLSRLTRWMVFLAAYHYLLIHQPGKHLAHADALSRCPLPAMQEDPAPASHVLLIEDLWLLVTAADIVRLSARDKVIA